MRRRSRCNAGAFIVKSVPYQLPPQQTSSQWSSWSLSCPRPSDGRCSVGEEMGHVTAAGHTFQSRVREALQRLTRKFSILVHSNLNSTRPSLLLPSFCGASSGTSGTLTRPTAGSHASNRHVPHQKIYVAPWWLAAS